MVGLMVCREDTALLWFFGGGSFFGTPNGVVDARAKAGTTASLLLPGRQCCLVVEGNYTSVCLCVCVSRCGEEAVSAGVAAQHEDVGGQHGE